MKSTVEQLSPTRVRINVEVPFEELKPDFDRAYKSLAQQVRLPGFRPGKAPSRLIEARVGRGNVLQQVVNDALPARYSEAVGAADLNPIGQPDIEVTKIEDGETLEFTAEVDVRPEITLPDYSQIAVTVDPIVVEDEAVDAELESLQQRFGTLVGVDRPVENGDFVSIDLSAAVDGTPVPEASTEGLSHEVGSGRLIEGLDETLVGLTAGESKDFPTKLVAGEHAGDEAVVTVTVQSVKHRELPEADDEFAQLASEFDTIEELKDSLRKQVESTRKIEQAGQIRDKVLDDLLERVEVAVPEGLVQAEVDAAVHNAIHGLDHDEEKLAEQLEAAGSSREEFDANTRAEAEKAIRTQLLLDAVAEAEEVSVSQDELTQNIIFQAQRYGMAPEQFIQQIQQANQLPALFADVRRSKALASIVDRVSVTDTNGVVVDTKEMFGDPEDEPIFDEADDSVEIVDETAGDETVEVSDASDTDEKQNA
ncbi:trigger factor [Millisia brevis]|uniref:trigger factor n=1 Tax=Millisia brevis TaxID=264148 RepID=UPI000830AB5A|nr:trigger factor [Millisia brevis]